MRQSGTDEREEEAARWQGGGQRLPAAGRASALTTGLRARRRDGQLCLGDARRVSRCDAGNLDEVPEVFGALASDSGAQAV